MHSLACEVLLPVPIERVFHTWTGGWTLWFAREAAMQLPARAGTPFYFEVAVPAAPNRAGARHAHYGRYLELSPPELVRFTWVTGPHGTGGTETIVTVRLRALAHGHTHCALQHEGFASTDARDRHAAAWPLILAAQGETLSTLSADVWERALASTQTALRNRSAPDASFIPTRSYPDLDAAVQWLVQVLGCRVRLRVPNERVQLTLGNGAVVVAAWDPAASPASGGRPPATLVVRVPDVDAAWTRALAHGATGVQAPQTLADGERQATVRDPAGHAWALTQTVADVDPADWGGVLVQ